MYQKQKNDEDKEEQDNDRVIENINEKEVIICLQYEQKQKSNVTFRQ